jgi:hypothetical protein
MSSVKLQVDNQLVLSGATNQLVFEPGGNASTNTFTITAAAPAASRTLTIPDPGANANILLSQGAQTVSGVQTFSSALNLTAAVGQLAIYPNGAGFGYNITTTNPAANRTLTIPDPGANANIMLDNTAGAVTQITSPTTAVTLNTRAGLITMEAACANTGSAFTLNNSYIIASSKVLAWSQNTLCATSSFPLTVVVSAIGAGSCTITVSGDGTHASAAAPIVQFIVI